MWMGLTPLPELDHYWSSNPLYQSLEFTKYMSRDRYQFIRDNIHFNSNEQAKNNPNKAFKILPLVELLNTAFRKHYVPSSPWIVDEDMIACHERAPFLQYMDRKPWGIKIWKLCDHNAYLFAFSIYSGESGEEIDGVHWSLGESVVLRLTESAREDYEKQHKRVGA